MDLILASSAFSYAFSKYIEALNPLRKIVQFSHWSHATAFVGASRHISQQEPKVDPHQDSQAHQSDLKIHGQSILTPLLLVELVLGTQLEELHLAHRQG